MPQSRAAPPPVVWCPAQTPAVVADKPKEADAAAKPTTEAPATGGALETKPGPATGKPPVAAKATPTHAQVDESESEDDDEAQGMWAYALNGDLVRLHSRTCLPRAAQQAWGCDAHFMHTCSWRLCMTAGLLPPSSCARAHMPAHAHAHDHRYSDCLCTHVSCLREPWSTLPLRCPR